MTIQPPTFGAAAYDEEVQQVATEWRYPLRGNPDAKIIVLCEPPSLDAARSSLPMDMDLLMMWATMALHAGLVQNDFLFVGLCPPVPKAVESSEAKKWEFVQPYVQGALDLIKAKKPAFVICAGALPARAVMGKVVKITRHRGMFHDSKHLDCPWFGMLSPKLVAAQPDNRPIMDADLSILRRVRDADHDPTILADIETNYEWCFDLSDWVANPPATLGIDTETTGLDTMADDFRVITVQLSDRPGMSRVCRICPDYFPDHPLFAGQDVEQIAKLRSQIKALLENPAITKVLHNGKYDFRALRSVGIEMGPWWDTELMARFVNENFMEYGLDEMIRIYVPPLAGYADHFNQTVNKSDMMSVPPVDETDLEGKVIRAGMLSYAGGDTDAVLRLAAALKPLLAADRPNLHVFNRIHRRALFALTKSMETYGFTIDEAALQSFQDELEAFIRTETVALSRMVPAPIRRKYMSDPKGFKFSRDEVMRDVFFSKDGFGFKPVVFTKGSTDDPDPNKRLPSVSTKDHLPYFVNEPGLAGQFVNRYRDLKQAQKMLDTYAKGFWKYIKTGADGEKKVIPSYNFRTNTRRTNCVHADTPVLTRRGEVRMADVRVGDQVFTHQNRWRNVTATYCKPADMMYKVSMSNGQSFLCTLGHMLMTETGWRSLYDVVLKDSGVEPGHRFGSAADVSRHGMFDEANRGASQNRDGEHARNHQAERAEGGDVATEIRPVSQQQAGGAEPRLREEACELHRRLCGWAGLLNQSGGWKTLLRASDRDGGNARPASFATAGEPDRASRGRGQAEQSPGQSGAFDHRSARHAASADGLEVRIVGVTPAAVFPVYDLTVEEDKSYTACGVVHHNSNDPNGQNFPKRGKFAKSFRRLFSASRGKVLVASDLSQAELRIAAWMAQEPEMLKVYRDDGDIHSTTAALVMGMEYERFLELDKATKKPARQGAKAVNFGYIYGARERTFMQVAKTDYGVDYTLKQATEIRNKFFGKFSALPVWHEKTRAFVKANGNVRSLHGLTRHLPAIWSTDWGVQSGAERNAVNSPVQNFGSDLGVMAFLRLSAQADPDLIRPVGFIHDQLIAEVDEGYVAEGMGWLKWVMENPPLTEWFGLVPPLPIKSDPEWGLNLGQTTELADDAEMMARVLPHVCKPEWWNDDEERAWDAYTQHASVPAHFLREVLFA